MLFNEQPVELTDSYYPVAIARGTWLAESRKIPGGAVAYLTDLGHPARRVREDISARLATPQERTTPAAERPVLRSRPLPRAPYRK
ncbi:hypothetical protein [Actinocrispum sp. NPDC049592]|uniref:hypothetical protein n=1 Tax=Actinocrispum sp. NPDC049592 TaxID=3154835 RepID=UPI00341FBD61